MFIHSVFEHCIKMNKKKLKFMKKRQINRRKTEQTLESLDKTMHVIFQFAIRFFLSTKCVSVVTCKLRSAFSIDGSFNKINKFNL